MSAPALYRISGKVLRVAIVATEAMRQEELRAMVASAGHQFVTATNDADVVILDGDAAIAETSSVAATLSIGGADNGHRAFLARDANADQVDAAIRAVAVGLIVRSAPETLIGFGAARQRNARVLLTPRELEMLSAIASGLSNKAIARQFDISLHTVKFHIESLFRKLGARSRAEAVAKGMERTRNETVQL